MKLTKHPLKEWEGARVLVTIPNQKVNGPFRYEGLILAVSSQAGQKSPRVLVGPPSEASFVRPKWMDPESLEVVELQ